MLATDCYGAPSQAQSKDSLIVRLLRLEESRGTIEAGSRRHRETLDGTSEKPERVNNTRSGVIEAWEATERPSPKTAGRRPEEGEQEAQADADLLLTSLASVCLSASTMAAIATMETRAPFWCAITVLR